MMRAPPSPAKLLQYPAAGGVALLATAISIMSLARTDVIEKLAINDDAFWREPWRLLTSTLPHLGVLHLVFNVYWTWVFGSALEQRYGHFRLFLAMLLFAAVPLAAEWAFLHVGCGLSGVGYGLFGWAWMTARRDPRFRDVVDDNTVKLFIGWGILCVITTVTGVFPVANIAHGVGLLLGVLLGLAASQPAWWGVLVAVSALSLAAASVWRPKINFDREQAGHIIAYRGQQALDAGDTATAIRLFERAVRYDPKYEQNLAFARYKAAAGL
jgi:membrane associated rhomboid family serine protease